MVTCWNIKRFKKRAPAFSRSGTLSNFLPSPSFSSHLRILYILSSNPVYLKQNLFWIIFAVDFLRACDKTDFLQQHAFDSFYEVLWKSFIPLISRQWNLFNLEFPHFNKLTITPKYALIFTKTKGNCICKIIIESVFGITSRAF